MLMRSSADKYPMMSNWKGAKFQTLCGRTFDSSTSLAEFLELQSVLSVTLLVKRKEKDVCFSSAENQ